MIKDYYELSKPGIMYGNILTTAAGFFAATHGDINWTLLLVTVVGLSLIIASGAACNNLIDRPIDARMERTKNRALLRGAMSPTAALVYAAAAGFLGAATLLIYTNPLTLAVATLGWVVYVCIYSPLKHRSSLAVFVGAFAGATPPVVGYSAVTGSLDTTAMWLFLFLFVWQIPHFLAIAVYRYDEYTAAGVPLLIYKRPTERQKRVGRIVFYFSLVVLLLWCAFLILHR